MSLNTWQKRQIAYAMTEDDLLTSIMEAAQYRGWRVHHVRRSDKALQMGEPGFPDLVLARGGDVLFIECKAMRGHISRAQADWLHHLSERQRPRTVEAMLARPVDLDDVLRRLE